MDRYRERTSMFFTRLASGPSWNRRPDTPLFGPPAPQTSLIFQLPNELIFSILFQISPDPRLASQYTWFRAQYGIITNSHHWRLVGFLQPLSMTCRAMRLRLLPWVWEYLEFYGYQNPLGPFSRKLVATVGALHTNASLATNVKFMMVYLDAKSSMLPSFIKCLKSLPNLHTLQVHWGDYITPNLKNMLKRVKLPQIKALILDPAAHPLLKHYRNVEDVVCLTVNQPPFSFSDKFLGSLASNRDSKVKRLAIPLVSWGNPSRYVAACPRLTELTVFYPPTNNTRAGILFEKVGSPSAKLELANACKALPDFDALQIVHYLNAPLRPPLAEQWQQALRGQVKDWMDCLKEPKTGCQEGEARKTTLRVIELRTWHHASVYLSSIKAKEYKV